MFNYLLNKFFNNSKIKRHTEKEKYLEWKENSGKVIGFFNGKFEYVIEEKQHPMLGINMISLGDSKYNFGWYKDINSAKTAAEEKIKERFNLTSDDSLNASY